MGFYKTSRTPIIAFKENSDTSFNKAANFSKSASHFQTEGVSIDIQASLDMVADEYKISKNPDDYVIVIARALTSDVPNENSDAFPAEELLRFDTGHGSRVFQTFINKPNHINHRADDPTQARGVILDAHYNDINEDDQFVEILVAVDKTKDKKLAESIQKGDINSMSMGCYAELCICSICNHEASSAEDLCPDHIRGGKKGREFSGQVSYEKCYKVCFQEESWVDEPADPTALVSEVMKIRASIDAVEQSKNIGYESEIFILNNKLANIEKALGSLAKTASAEKEADEFTDTVDEAKENISEFYNGGSTSVNVKVTKAEETSMLDSLDENIKPMTAKEFGVVESKSEEEKKMTSKNPYEKLADIKKTSKGGGNPSDWKNTDSGKGNPPKEWDKPGKGDGTTPSEWKIAGMSKEALDNKAKDYWTKYYKDGYGLELIKDIKKKKIAVNAAISLEQMKVLEPKFAGIMGELNMESIKPSSIYKLAELIGIEIGAADKKDKETSELVTRTIDDTTDKKWKSLDAKIASGDVTLDLMADGCWHLKDADDSLAVVENVDSLSSEEFESDDFGQKLCSSFMDSGSEKTAEVYKVSKYPAVPLVPSFVDESNDDFRGDVRVKPSSGAEEEGTDDLSKVDRATIKEDGVDEGGQRDVKMAATEKTADETSLGDASMLVDKLTDIAKEPAMESDVQDKLKNIASRWVELKAPKAADIASIASMLIASFQAAKTEGDAAKDILSVIERYASVNGIDKDAFAVAVAEYFDGEGEGVDEDSEGDEGEGAGGEDIEAKKKKSPKKDKDEDEDKDTKEAGVLDDAEDDLAGTVRTEQNNGILADGTTDLEGVDRESVEDTVYDKGADDLEEERGSVVRVGSNEEVDRITYLARLNRALKLAIRRANLNLIDNELKATMHDTLTSVSDLPDGDEYTGMDSSLAKNLIEQVFELGASKFFDDMIKEANKILELPEDAFLAIEADAENLKTVIPASTIDAQAPEYTYEEPISAKAEEAMNGNPVFKSSSVDTADGNHSGLRGIFRPKASIITAAERLKR